VAADPKAIAKACIDMGFSRKRPRRNDECFESFSGNVQSTEKEFVVDERSDL
jgi:hypothetical protein